MAELTYQEVRVMALGDGSQTHFRVSQDASKQVGYIRGVLESPPHRRVRTGPFPTLYQ